jgi:hypothetical protein
MLGTHMSSAIRWFDFGFFFYFAEVRPPALT